MTILALEFSSEQRSVAVMRAGRVLAEAVQSGGRMTNALGMIEKVLADAKLRREEIEAIAVGLGPGSYTGIRAAIAVAQGWQLAREVKLVGISSVEAMAAQMHLEQNFGRVHVVVDAQRGEFYLAGYAITAESWQETEPLKIVKLEEVWARVNAGDVLAGPEVTRWFTRGRTLFPQAAAVAQAAASRSDGVLDGLLEPIYLRVTSFKKLGEMT